MKAYRISAKGQPPSLDDIDQPVPGRGEVLVRIAACGLNFADLLTIEGRYQDMPEPPFTMGMELAGEVVALGAGVEADLKGRRVAVFAGQGGLAEFGVFPASACIPLPDEMSFTDAAGFLIAYGTSHLGLTGRASLGAGQTLVVLGAAGGVGLTAVEVGKAVGATVVAVVRGAEKAAIASSAGADHVIDSEAADLRDEIKALGGADVVYDAVGGEQFTAAMRACKPFARILVIGFASGDVPQIPANIIMVKNLDVIGFYWGAYARLAPEKMAESIADLFDLYRQGRLHPHVQRTFPLEQAGEALDWLKGRKSAGKIVVTMRP